MRWTEIVARIHRRNTYIILSGKRKRPFRRPRHRWEDNTKMCFWEIWSEAQLEGPYLWIRLYVTLVLNPCDATALWACEDSSLEGGGVEA